MPDICLCQAKNEHGVCPQKDKCYRFTAEPNPYRQSYFMVAPFTIASHLEIPETACDYFSPKDA